MAGLNHCSMLKFDKENKKINDICGVVEDRKFWRSRQHLSLHSEYIYTMLNEDFPEANMKEVILNDPQTPNDFHLFLLIISGLRQFDDFDDEAITRVLSLSNRWITKVTSMVCQGHLLKSERSTLKEKVFIGGGIHIGELQGPAYHQHKKKRTWTL